MRILLAEDFLALREMCREMLERAGHKVVLALDGEEAWKTLTHDGQEFDLILSDNSMPGIRGTELLHRLREKEKMTGARRTPFILMSDADPWQYERYCAERNASFLKKPFTDEELNAKLLQLGDAS